MDVQWRDVTVDVPGKRILHPCSGGVGPGRMVALMGPSGSGKTTLLSSIRQDRPYSGVVRFDGKPFAPKLRQSIGFVEQDDVVIPALTVRQSLQFLAELHFGPGSDEAATRVAKLLSELRLEVAADTVIGDQDAAEKISGGQKKRLCIARELLSHPRLLLCDEPTSGLDSTMALQVVESMRQLCDARSVSVMASIHQPSTAIFEHFDDVILLKEGEVVFSGSPSEVESILTAHGPLRGPLQSASEYIMDCLILDLDPPLRVPELTSLAREKAAKLQALEVGAVNSSSGKCVDDGPLRQQIPVARELLVLYRRHLRLVCQISFTRQNLLLNAGLVFIASLLWWRLDFDISTIESRHSTVCWTVGTWMFLPMIGGIGTFSAEEDMVRKELKSGNYALRSYYIARTLMITPMEIVTWPTLWVTGVFWLTNLSSSFSVYVRVLLMVWLTFSTFQAVGLMIAASSMPMGSAVTLSILLIFYFFGWTPLLMDLRRVQSWLHWAGSANIFNKAVEMIFSVVVEDMQFVCGSEADLTKARLGCEDGVVSGEEARARMGISTSPITCLLILIACCVVFRILAFILLRHSYREAIDGASVVASKGVIVEVIRPTPAEVPGSKKEVPEESHASIAVTPPALAMDVQWREVSVDVPGKRILHPCSGRLGAGRMVALMGPSGSGKTTLLSSIRQDRPYSGVVRFDGKPFGAKLRQSIGFVEQEDVVIEAMTTRQSLRFLAELRLGLGSRKAAMRVSELLGQLRLEDVADTVLKDVSGGERKRFCIARELLSDPRLLLCDEPTTGLDSTMAEQVVESMRRLCSARSVSVLASIHQPSTCIFEHFDDMILLSHGKVVFSGPMSKIEAVFGAHGPPRRPQQSIAEYVMDCIQLDLDPPLRMVELTALAREQAAALPALEAAGPAESVLASLSGAAHANDGHARQQIPFARQVLMLFRRHARLVIDGMFTRQQVGLMVGMVLIAALLWWRLGLNIEDIEPRFACVCWSVGTWMFVPIFGGTGIFAAEKAVVLKELKSGNYALGSYYVARTLMMFPLDIVWPTIWLTGVFWMTNLNPSFGVYLKVLVRLYLTFATFQSVGYVIAATGMPPDSANTFANLIITFFFGWTQLLMDLRRAQPWLQWVANYNPFKYAIEMVFSVVVEDLEFACSSAAGLEQASLGCQDGVVTGSEARARLIITSSPTSCIWILLGCTAVLRVAAFALLRYNYRAAIDGAKAIASPVEATADPATAALPEAAAAPEPTATTAQGASGADDLVTV